MQNFEKVGEKQMMGHTRNDWNQLVQATVFHSH